MELNNDKPLDDTKESFEKRQKEVDAQRDAYKALLSPEDRNKIEVVEKVMQDLSDADVKAFVYVLHKNPTYNDEVMHLYHTFNKSMTFNEDGSFTQEWKDYYMKVFNMLLSSVYSHPLISKTEDVVANVFNFARIIYNAILTSNKYYNSILKKPNETENVSQ